MRRRECRPHPFERGRGAANEPVVRPIRFGLVRRCAFPFSLGFSEATRADVLFSHPEARTAPAALLRVRVEELEPASDELLGVVQLQPVQVQHGLGVHHALEHLGGVLVDLVLLLDLVLGGEVHHVAEPRAAAVPDPHAQYHEGVRVLLLRAELPQPLHRLRLDVDDGVFRDLVIDDVVLVLVVAVVLHCGGHRGVVGGGGVKGPRDEPP
mmetsp:Transcript_7511/g.18487  ORF Transcript_7511/g.18487 Transcript_7511/m.18487 type:complete len:210 (+) Transcript_7511:132-761(+)